MWGSRPTQRTIGDKSCSICISGECLFSTLWTFGLLMLESTGNISCSFILSYVGNVEINVEVKRYFCKAGVKGIQVCLTKRKIIMCLVTCTLYIKVLILSCLFNLSLMLLLVRKNCFTDFTAFLYFSVFSSMG